MFERCRLRRKIRKCLETMTRSEPLSEAWINAENSFFSALDEARFSRRVYASYIRRYNSIYK